MASIVNIHEAKTHLSKLLVQVENGEEVIIARGGEPVAKLVPLSREKRKERKLGLMRGMFVVPDDFDAPLTEQELSEFE
jgi:prevent-host-death family protein